METNLLHDATFSEVYRFLKNKPDDTIFQCFKNLFGVALLFFPALMCQNVAAITDLATGATIVGAGVGTIIGNAAKSAFAFFKNKNHSDYSTRYQHMQIAQVMLVYASYFDTIIQCLPNENGEITLSADKKWKISQDGFQAYFKKLTESVQHTSPKLLDTELALPNPTQNFSQYIEELKGFYKELNSEFIKFFEQLSFWEEIDKDQKEYFYDLLSQLPMTAVCTYEQQYFELSKEFPEFAVWANHTEHSRLEAQIDVGFKQIAEKLNSIAQHSESKAPDTLEHYRIKYANYINSPIINPNANNFAEDIVFPAKKDIFIPQAFLALSYRRPMELEPSATWKDAFSGEDIGQYISNILRHPQYGMLPLLILGLPGAGKTLLCRMLAAQILSAEYHVIIIKLRDTIAEDTIMKQIDAQIERDFGDNCTWNDLRSAYLDKPILLIFDGYDELLQASGKTHSDYLNKIAEFQLDQEKIYHIFVRCIVTSRSTLIDKASIPDNSQILHLCDFDNSRIKIWSKIWNQANEQYFNTHHLKKLEIASSGKVKELAGQPLLLLMLALYDMSDNHLQGQHNISRSELYYELIRDFIIREKEKSSDYNQLDSRRQEIEVQNAFRNLGIAALGMYNRRKLFIRTTELNSDLSFLAPKRTENTNEYSLEECDKLVGSFFFIHSSKSSTQTSNAYVKAYEFLHNTFGEFLTAYYILDILFHLIIRQIRDVDMGESFTWPDKLRNEWHTCLAYAALFTRPVVLNMIHELSEILAQEKHMETEKVRDALDSLFHDEIRHIINGDAFATLNETLKMQGNPFKHPELMIHMATYSVNLVLLRVTVCSNNFVFTKMFDSDKDWHKLTHIWRYAFTEEELVNLSSFLNLMHLNGTHKLIYEYDEAATKQAISLSKLGRLRSISNVLGDDAIYAILAILGAFELPLDKNIYSILQKEELRLETQYALNAVISCLLSSDEYEWRHLKDLMYHLLMCCEKEHNPFGVYVYCTILHTLVELYVLNREDVHRLLSRDIFVIIDETARYTGKKYSPLFFGMILQELLGCISALPMPEKIDMLHKFASFFSYMFPNSFLDPAAKSINRYITNIFSLFCGILQSILGGNRQWNTEGICYKLMIAIMETDYMRFISWYGVESVLKLCQALKKEGYAHESHEIFFMCLHKIDLEYFIMSIRNASQSNPHAFSVLIDCCYYMEQSFQMDHYKNRFRDMLGFLWNQVLERINMILILFPTYQQSFYYLLCLLCNDVLCNDVIHSRQFNTFLESILNMVMEGYGKQLPVHTLKKISECGEIINSKQICDKVKQLLKE